MSEPLTREQVGCQCIVDHNAARSHSRECWMRQNAALTQTLARVEVERNKAECFLARIASLRIDETGTACFSHATDGRGIDGWRVAEQARQTFQQLTKEAKRGEGAE